MPEKPPRRDRHKPGPYVLIRLTVEERALMERAIAIQQERQSYKVIGLKIPFSRFVLDAALRAAKKIIDADEKPTLLNR